MEKGTRELEQIKIQIEVLEVEIRNRSTQFRKNQQMIEMLLDAEHSPDIEEALKRYTQANQNILEENERAISTQNELINDYVTRAWEIQQAPREFERLKYAESLLLTLDGTLPLNDTHPFYNDAHFLSEALRHFEQEEKYEQCAAVVNQLRSLETQTTISAVA